MKAIQVSIDEELLQQLDADPDVCRDDAIAWLHTVTVAPITSTIRGLPSEVVIGLEEGLKQESAVNLDQLQTVERAALERFCGSLTNQQMRRVCEALSLALDCD